MPNISKMVANLKANPLQRANRFKISINGPIGQLRQEILMNCNATAFPGRSFDTAELYTYGPPRKVPYLEIFDDITTQFFLREDMAEFEYFYNWQNLIGNSGDNRGYSIAYYDDLVGTVAIQPVTYYQGITKKTMIMYEAYPAVTSEVPFDYGSTNQFTMYTITWKYHHFEFE